MEALFERGQSVSHLVFRGKPLEIEGKWQLPLHYNPEEDVLLELVATRTPSAKVQQSIQHKLKEFGILASFDGKSLFISPAIPMEHACLDAAVQFRCYTRKKVDAENLNFLSSPLWRTQQPQQVIAHASDLSGPGQGILALEVGEKIDECRWPQFVESGAFAGVVGLVPSTLEVIVYGGSQGKQVFKDPDFVDLGEFLSSFRFYVTALPRMLWPTSRKDRNYLKGKTGAELTEIVCSSILSGDVEEAKAAVCFLWHLNVMNSEGRIPLVLAVWNNLEDLVKFMCDLGADVDFSDQYGRSARTEAKGRIQEFINREYPSTITTVEVGGLTVSSPQPSIIHVSGLTREQSALLQKLISNRRVEYYQHSDVGGITSNGGRRTETMCLELDQPDDDGSFVQEIISTLVP